MTAAARPKGRAESKTGASVGPLSVMLVTEPVDGGTGRHVLDLAGGLAARGHDVLLCHGTDRLGPRALDALTALERAGVAIAPIPTLRRSPGLTDPRALASLRARARAHAGRVGRARVDVIHAHATKAGLLVSALRGVSRARCWTPHGLRTLDPTLRGVARAAWSTAERGIGAWMDGTVCVSTGELAHAAALGVPVGRLAHLPNGVAPTPACELGARRTAARAQLGIPAGAFCVGVVGRLAPQKAPETALRVLTDVLAARDTSHGVFVGGPAPESGPREMEVADALAAGAERWGGRLHWLPRGDGRLLMVGFDVLLATSRWEGLPYVFLEALDAGVPVITTNVAGAAECVLPAPSGAHLAGPACGAAGIVIEQPGALADPVPTLVEAVLALADDLSRRHQLATAARARAAEFTLDRLVDRAERLYHDLLVGRAAARAA